MLDKNWCRQHASAIYVAFLFFGGLGLICLGEYGKALKAPDSFLNIGAEKLSVPSEIIFQLGVALFILALTSVLFSFSDLKETIAANIAGLFSRGEIVPILSEGTKDALHKRLSEERIRASNKYIPEDLYNFSTSLSDEMATGVHAYDLKIHKTVDAFTAATGTLFSYGTTTSYELSAEHFLGEECTIPIRSSLKTTFPYPAPISKADWFKVFKIKIGSDTYDIKDTIITEKVEGKTQIFEMKFEKKITFKKRVVVEVESESISPKADTTEFLLTKYPTKRFSGSFTTLSGKVCQAVWVTAYPRSSQEPRVQCPGDGKHCTFETGEWVSPKNGVVIYID